MIVSNMQSPLLNFLTQARSAALRSRTSTSPVPLTWVLGNSSCDLDSFISATVYSFFRSRFPKNSEPACLHVPILNLSAVKSSELWRLRPEFGTALKLAVQARERTETDRGKDSDSALLENLLTLSDLSDFSSIAPTYPSPHWFRASAAGNELISVVLVDHNALSIQNGDMSLSEMSSKFNIVGCIDHHVDESFTPTTASPRIIRTGIGSCTSLIVTYVRELGGWEELINSSHEFNGQAAAVAAVELAKLSLASILIDTTNLTAEGKVSDTDLESVRFLEEMIRENEEQTHSTASFLPVSPIQRPPWDRRLFYESIAQTKADSLSLLSLPEILGRDYKVWSDKTTNDGELKVGIASIIRPIKWLIERSDASCPAQFMSGLQKFAQHNGLAVDLIAIMTASTSDDGQFQRELLLVSLTQAEKYAEGIVRRFEVTGREHLGLEPWTEDDRLVNLLQCEYGNGGRIWRQRDASKSRKQVAPLLREAIRGT